MAHTKNQILLDGDNNSRLYRIWLSQNNHVHASFKYLERKYDCCERHSGIYIRLVLTYFFSIFRRNKIRT